MPRAVLLLGPTGSGKTALSLRLAEELPIEIVNVDSAQVYRGMDIGTAKPDAAERARVPHHLLDIRDPEAGYSAGEFRDDCLARVYDIHARGRIPLLAGGTMLYFRSLLHGLAPLPQADAAVRADIDARAARDGWPALHGELARLDPESAARIHPNDAQRIQRALEIVLVAGVPRSELWRRDASRISETRLRYAAFSLEPGDRELLHRGLQRRFDAMLEAGFVDEVRQLMARPALQADATAMRAVGYRQMWSFCDGETSWPEACAAAVAATRQLAKRQLTWLRSDLTAPAETRETFDSQNSKCYERFRDAVLQWLQRTVQRPQDHGS
ncbi:MAG: tRNA (adenosine(37)-N6)-dimethylallyltransferase MiaA [Steroidobacteraceae bacterium]